jgi:hypothetical protein
MSIMRSAESGEPGCREPDAARASSASPEVLRNSRRGGFTGNIVLELRWAESGLCSPAGASRGRGVTHMPNTRFAEEVTVRTGNESALRRQTAKGWRGARYQAPVISFSNEKNARLRLELMPQFTGRLW